MTRARKKLIMIGDSATLGRLLRKLLTEPELGARIGAAGRESIRLRHSPERVLARLEDLYFSMGLAAAPVVLRKAA